MSQDYRTGRLQGDRVLLPPQRKVGPGIHAQQGHLGRLYRMNNEGEENGGRFGHTIDDKHRLHREMPRACAIGRRHQHRKRTNAEYQECRYRRDAGGEIEAEEGEGEMQEIVCACTEYFEGIDR